MTVSPPTQAPRAAPRTASARIPPRRERRHTLALTGPLPGAPASPSRSVPPLSQLGTAGRPPRAQLESRWPLNASAQRIGGGGSRPAGSRCSCAMPTCGQLSSPDIHPQTSCSPLISSSFEILRRRPCEPRWTGYARRGCCPQTLREVLSATLPKVLSRTLSWLSATIRESPLPDQASSQTSTNLRHPITALAAGGIRRRRVRPPPGSGTRSAHILPTWTKEARSELSGPSL